MHCFENSNHTCSGHALLKCTNWWVPHIDKLLALETKSVGAHEDVPQRYQEQSPTSDRDHYVQTITRRVVAAKAAELVVV